MQERTREDKIEAIIGICKYDRKLVDALETLVKDFISGKVKKPSELLGTVMQGINWTVEVLNQVMDVLNEGEEKVNKQMVNDALVEFHAAFTSEDEERLIEVISHSLIPCLEHICKVGEKFA